MIENNTDAHILVSMTYASRANSDVSANDFNEILDFLKDNNFNRLTNFEINNLANSIINTPGKWKNITEQTFDKIINATGVCCFTKEENNLLMWSHYTESHKGVCLKFDILKDTDFFVYPLPVNYRDDYPDYNHLGNRQTLVNDIVLSKSNDWSYEQEIRVLKIHENGLIPFKKNALIEIIFGCKTPKREIDKIISLSVTKDYTIKFKQAKK